MDHKRRETDESESKAKLDNRRTEKPPQNCTYSSLKCIYTNLDSFLNKREELKTRVHIELPQIIGLTELKPKLSFPFR